MLESTHRFSGRATSFFFILRLALAWLLAYIAVSLIAAFFPLLMIPAHDDVPSPVT